jgi:hypothetical protein
MFGSVSAALASAVGTSGRDDLIIAEGGKATATIAVAADAGSQETNAAEDLATYIESGARPQIVNTLPVNGTVIVVGELAIETEPALLQALDRVVKKNPRLGTDGIVLRRAGSRLYVAGNNAARTNYAVAELLEQWGIRWYLPTLYAQAQGVVTDDGQSFTGHLWYQTEINLTAQQIADNVHLRFPGIFNEC